MTPGGKDGFYEGIPGTSEMMRENGGDDQVTNNLVGYRDSLYSPTFICSFFSSWASGSELCLLLLQSPFFDLFITIITY